MPLLPSGLSQLAATAFTVLEPIFVRQRAIGIFTANVTVEEQHLDELSITDHPVEQGSVISDHAYKRPASVTIRAMWSNSSLPADGNPNYVQEIYDAFLVMQASRIPIDVLTGKRAYLNMLIQRLQITTDEKSENALNMVCECREIQIAMTQTVTVLDPTNMKTPALNASPILA